MNKQTYLTSLKHSLSALPADQVEDILRDYDQHFIDALASGRSEKATSRALGDPRKIALEFKAMAHLDAFQNKHSLANFWRMAVALGCMVGFNVFLLPFMVIAPLMLLSLYLLSLSCLAGGATIMSSGLLGIDKIAYEHDGRRIALVVKQTGLLRSEQNSHGLQAMPYTIDVVDETLANQRAEAISDEPYSNTTKTFIGALYVAAGVALLLLNRKLAGYLGSGTRRYLNANANILGSVRRNQGVNNRQVDALQ